MRKIAAQVGVTTPSVYLHFADKLALVEAVAARAWSNLDQHMRDAREGVDYPMRALRRTGPAYVRFAVDHPVQYRLLLMNAPGEAREAQHQAARACLDHVVAAVRPCVEAGILRGDAEQLALRMWSAVHGCAALLISQPQLPWSTDTIGDEVARMAGLGTAMATRLDARAYYPVDAFTVALDGAAAELRQTRDSNDG
jgi:AcrR family transcriptional regulator